MQLFKDIFNLFHGSQNKEVPDQPIIQDDSIAQDTSRYYSEIVLSPTPKIGVVIGTYAAVPYIALQLESRKRYWPEAAVLIHDDSSHSQDELRSLCCDSDADFVSTPFRLEPTVGDMNAFVAGLDWARDNNLDILVKLSRRYLLYHNWIPALQQLAYNTQYATYTNACVHYNFPFRPECVGMHVPTWHASGAVDEMRSAIAENKQVAEFVETWYQDLSCRVHRDFAPTVVRKREALFPRSPSWGGYGVWNMLGQGRHSRLPGILWHDIHTPADYWELANQWGLPYSLQDFDNLNMHKENNLFVK